MAHRKLAIIRRRIFTALSVLSLLLCVATVALWVRSYWRLDALVHRRSAVHQSFRSVCGELCYTTSTSKVTSTRYVWRPEWRYIVQNPGDRMIRPTHSLLGFGWVLEEAMDYFLGIFIPHWFLALLFAILPALHLRSMLRSRRLHRLGHCPRCGYDLRATPDRCPECGLLTAETQRTQSESVC